MRTLSNSRPAGAIAHSWGFEVHGAGCDEFSVDITTGPQLIRYTFGRSLLGHSTLPSHNIEFLLSYVWAEAPIERTPTQASPYNGYLLGQDDNRVRRLRMKDEKR